MEEINKIFNRLREKTFTKKDSKGHMCNEWADCLSYNDDIQPIKELILSEIETLKAENAELKKQLGMSYKIGQVLYFISKKLPAINLTSGEIEESVDYDWQINEVKINNIYIYKKYKNSIGYDLFDENNDCIDINLMFKTKELAENRLKELKEGK